LASNGGQTGGRRARELGTDLLGGKSPVAERFDKPLGCLPQAAHTGTPINRNATGYPSATAPIADQPAIGLQLPIGAGDGVRRDAKVAGELTNRGQRRVGRKIPAFDRGPDLRDDLLIWRDF
jgi:hypothetical protein